jgi:peptide/nickel transport system permease protein
MASKGSALSRFLASDLGHSFRCSPLAITAFVMLVLLIASAFLAPWISPQNPHDLSQLFIEKAEIPPIWAQGGEWPYLLGTDPQGRDVLSAILYGTRVSLIIGLAAVAVSMAVGVTIGLMAGFFGGWIDNLLMRIADTVLSIPTLLVAILVSAIFRGILPPAMRDPFAAIILVLAIALTGWVQYARTVRGTTLVERNKEYVQAARVTGVAPLRIMLRHVLPNVLGPVTVLATIQVASAIITEATLSFLGVGVPPTSPSLGTLIRIGNDFLFSGEWWITIFPGLTLVLIALSVNLLGDWLRDALNPRLR